LLSTCRLLAVHLLSTHCLLSESWFTCAAVYLPSACCLLAVYLPSTCRLLAIYLPSTCCLLAVSSLSTYHFVVIGVLYMAYPNGCQRYDTPAEAKALPKLAVHLLSTCCPLAVYSLSTCCKLGYLCCCLLAVDLLFGCCPLTVCCYHKVDPFCSQMVCKAA
jgi:hypothetical protein